MLDKKYDAHEKENKWLEYWKENKIYEFKPDKREVFSIDTPPPSVNGKIHIGHIFSYSQSEMIDIIYFIHLVLMIMDYLVKD